MRHRGRPHYKTMAIFSLAGVAGCAAKLPGCPVHSAQPLPAAILFQAEHAPGPVTGGHISGTISNDRSPVPWPTTSHIPRSR